MEIRLATITMFFLGVGLLILSAGMVLFYGDWSPEDKKAATVYYISPNGSDTSGNGSNSSPWATITKANASISSGDTVVLKDGVYKGYFNITKANTTWEAENKHKAIIDGEFGPSLLNGKWSNIMNAFNQKCSSVGDWKALLTVQANSVVVDGLGLRNSCGRGLLIGDYNSTIVQNNYIDWTLKAGIYVAHKSKDTRIVDNIFTRTAFNDVFHFYRGDGYSVNALLFMGENTIVKGNIIAWNRSEIAPNGAKNLIFEENVVVGNKVNLYPGLSTGITARNNTFYDPETDDFDGTHWELQGGLRERGRRWSLTSRNEIEDRWVSFSRGLDSLHIYNNVIINNSIHFNGYHLRGGATNHSTDTTNLYFGHNTVVAGHNSNTMLSMAFGANKDKNSKITGTFENNIYDTRKNSSTRISASLDNNDSVVFRNNIWPKDVHASVKGSGDIYTDDPGLVSSLGKINLEIPGIGVPEVDLEALQQVMDINNYRLKQTSPAIDKGSAAGNTNNTTIPPLVRTEDYFRAKRVGVPDIGAIEFGGVQTTQSPNPTNTLTPTNTTVPINTIVPQTPTPSHTAVPSASNPQGNICGKADADGDGMFKIYDFGEFAKAYGNGKNTCADRNVDYGPCGGRDVNRDGFLNIGDFGTTGTGFAQRYYPKTSCAL